MVEPWRDNLSNLKTESDILIYTTTLCAYAVHLFTPDFYSLCKRCEIGYRYDVIFDIVIWVKCNNDVMNDADYLITRDLVHRKLFHVPKISVLNQKGEKIS